MRTSDRERTEAISLLLAKGYTERLDLLVKQKSFDSRPQLIEFFIDSFENENGISFMEKKIRSDIELKEDEIKTLKANLKALDKERGKIQMRKEVLGTQEKLKYKEAYQGIDYYEPNGVQAMTEHAKKIAVHKNLDFDKLLKYIEKKSKKE